MHLQLLRLPAVKQEALRCLKSLDIHRPFACHTFLIPVCRFVGRDFAFSVILVCYPLVTDLSCYGDAFFIIVKVFTVGRKHEYISAFFKTFRHVLACDIAFCEYFGSAVLAYRNGFYRLCVDLSRAVHLYGICISV